MKNFISLKSGTPIISDPKNWAKVGNSYTLKENVKEVHYFDVSVKALNGVKPSFDFENDPLRISGIANANIVDRVQERLDPVGLDVEHYLKNPQLLAHHDYRCPIGQVESIEVQEDGVYFTGWIGNPQKAPLTQIQKDIRSLVLQGVLKTVSVGFIPKKVKAPIFSQNGDLEEAPVIESWELLEISVVSVPANQGSIFDIRSFSEPKQSAILENNDNSKNNIEPEGMDSMKKGIDTIKEELASQAMVVQTLIFSKEKFTKEQAQKWCKDHNFESEGVDETTDSYRIRQEDPSLFDPNSFKTIDITEGVKAVVGKKKEGKEGEPNQVVPQDQNQTFEEKVLMSLQKIQEGIDKLCGGMEPEGEAPIVEEGCKPKKEFDELHASIAEVKKHVEQLAIIVSAIVADKK
jgi:HK97 family phage prohead protease